MPPLPWLALRVPPPIPPPCFTIIIEPFDDRIPTISNPILHFSCGHRGDTGGGGIEEGQGYCGGDRDAGEMGGGC